MYSPIRYYGGKSSQVDTIKSYFPDSYDSYIEGFGGGASLLLSMEPCGFEVYNDLGENVYSLFKCLADKELFIKLKEKMDLTLYSEQIRAEYKEALKGELSILDRAYMFLYVNRTSFNGTGGFSVINHVCRGMSKSTSDYLSMIDRLPEIHNRLSRVVIEHKDIMDILDKYNESNIFIYLDPPYVHSTRLSNTKYEKEMSDEQHELLLKKLLTMKSKILISGYDSDLYNKYLNEKNGWYKVVYEAPKNKAKNITQAFEVLWMNYKKEDRDSVDTESNSFFKQDI